MGKLWDIATTKKITNPRIIAIHFQIRGARRKSQLMLAAALTQKHINDAKSCLLSVVSTYHA